MYTRQYIIPTVYRHKLPAVSSPFPLFALFPPFPSIEKRFHRSIAVCCPIWYIFVAVSSLPLLSPPSSSFSPSRSSLSARSLRPYTTSAHCWLDPNPGGALTSKNPTRQDTHRCPDIQPPHEESRGHILRVRDEVVDKRSLC